MKSCRISPRWPLCGLRAGERRRRAGAPSAATASPPASSILMPPASSSSSPRLGVLLLQLLLWPSRRCFVLISMPPPRSTAIPSAVVPPRLPATAEARPTCGPSSRPTRMAFPRRLPGAPLSSWRRPRRRGRGCCAGASRSSATRAARPGPLWRRLQVGAEGEEWSRGRAVRSRWQIDAAGIAKGSAIPGSERLLTLTIASLAPSSCACYTGSAAGRASLLLFAAPAAAALVALAVHVRQRRSSAAAGGACGFAPSGAQHAAHPTACGAGPEAGLKSIIPGVQRRFVDLAEVVEQTGAAGLYCGPCRQGGIAAAGVLGTTCRSMQSIFVPLCLLALCVPAWRREPHQRAPARPDALQQRRAWALALQHRERPHAKPWRISHHPATKFDTRHDAYCSRLVTIPSVLLSEHFLILPHQSLHICTTSAFAGAPPGGPSPPPNTPSLPEPHFHLPVKSWSYVHMQSIPGMQLGAAGRLEIRF